MRVTFPSSFLWGSSISSYQVEGNNLHSDWYFWEKQKRLVPSGSACRHYDFFLEDFELARQLSHNSLRFSTEWARIAPQETFFAEEALTHYARQADELTQRGITPMVTLHHFTNPIWFSKKGGWTVAKNIDFFLSYITKTVDTLLPSVRYFIIFNEPIVYIYNGFIRGIWPPGYKSFRLGRKALNNIVTACTLAYKEIKRRAQKEDTHISIAKNLIWFLPCSRHNLGQNHFFSFTRDRAFNYFLLDKLCKMGVLDFLGVNYYYKQYVKNSMCIFGKECKDSHHKDRKNTLGWNVSPQGFSTLLLSLKRYGLPVIITENGTSENDDSLCADFLFNHIKALAHAFLQGLDCQGYMWWSLLDNFEWDKGYAHRFGLIDVDFNTFKRSVKPFARYYKKIIDENAITF